MDNNIDKIINEGVKSIKPFPNLVQKAINLIDSGDVENHVLANVIKQDPILSTRILSLANSPFYGLSRKVEDIETSCVILGFNVIKNILTSLAAFDCFPLTEQRMNVWSHSVEVATISECIAKKYSPSETTIYTAGLLHDVGKFLLLDLFPEHKSLIESDCAVYNEDSLNIETEMMGVNHAQVGAEIIAAWNLPDDIQKTVEKHHILDEAKNCEMCRIINLADELSHKNDANKSDEELINELNYEYIHSAGLDVNEVSLLLPVIRERIELVKGAVNMF